MPVVVLLQETKASSGYSGYSYGSYGSSTKLIGMPILLTVPSAISGAELHALLREATLPLEPKPQCGCECASLWEMLACVGM